MKLQPYDYKIISELLNQAADDFSNHGCNDYDTSFLTNEQKEELNKRMTESGLFDCSEGLYNFDFCLMNFYSNLFDKMTND